MPLARIAHHINAAKGKPFLPPRMNEVHAEALRRKSVRICYSKKYHPHDDLLPNIRKASSASSVSGFPTQYRRACRFQLTAHRTPNSACFHPYIFTLRMREVWICKNDFCAAANRIYDSLEMLHRECAVAADENARGLTLQTFFCLIEHLFGQFAYFITL